MGRQFLRVYRVPNEQAFLGSPAQDAMQVQQLNAMPPAPAIPPPPPMLGAPGMPPGAPMGGPPMGPPALPPMMPGPQGLQ